MSEFLTGNKIPVSQTGYGDDDVKIFKNYGTQNNFI